MTRYQPVTEQGYEGKTVPLNASLMHDDGYTGRRCVRFPWWMLWLIWPLGLLVMVARKSWLAMWATLTHTLGESPLFQPGLLPLLLIGAGVVILLHARRRRD
jgi:hypothetical protein